jgi:DNA-binding MarR family transcriptional regulator
VASRTLAQADEAAGTGRLAVAVAAPVPAQLAEETGYLLRRAYVQAGKWAQAVLPPGVPSSHYEVLQALADLGPRSQHELGELLCVNRTIMVKLIDSLERDGLVQRHRNPSDRRSYALKLTPRGRSRLTGLTPAADRAEASFTAPLNRAEHDRLRGLLRRIVLAEPPALELPATLARQAGYLLTRTHFGVRDQVNQRFRELGLTTALYGTLTTIATAGPTSQQVIADQLGLTGPAIVQTVDRLQAAGLVERHRDPADRRSYALQPTDQGRHTLKRARDAVAEINRLLDHALGGTAQRHQLNQLLRKLLNGA